MRDAHNGVPLWQRPLPDASAATRTSGMVLLTDALYLAEGPDVLILDPASGRELGRVDCAALGEQVKWLAIQAGTLYAMAGSKEKPLAAHQTWKVFGSEPFNFGKCGAFGAYHLAGKKWLWTQEEQRRRHRRGHGGHERRQVVLRGRRNRGWSVAMLQPAKWLGKVPRWPRA